MSKLRTTIKNIDTNDIVRYAPLVILGCVLIKGWDAIIGFAGIILTAIIPLVLGFAIAYVVSIPVSFMERHIFPNAQSTVARATRRPLALLIMAIVALAGMVVTFIVLFPALADTVLMVQQNGQAFVMNVVEHPLFAPVRSSVQEFVQGDFVQSLVELDIKTITNTLFGGAVGNLGAQVFGVVSGIMTGFFSILFSFILLTDTSDMGNTIMLLISDFFGPAKAERIALSLGIVDASFHNFIVRQFVEALLLGSVGVVVLMAARFPYALGVGMLMFLAALVPIMGYPMGLVASGFIVVINSPLLALVYVLSVGITQLLESTLLLPHIGDPRTTIPPVLVTVGVTIGGGVAGFIGMLVAIPLASSIFQLMRIDARMLSAQREKEQQEPGE